MGKETGKLTKQRDHLKKELNEVLRGIRDIETTEKDKTNKLDDEIESGELKSEEEEVQVVESEGESLAEEDDSSERSSSRLSAESDVTLPLGNLEDEKEDKKDLLE